MHLFWEDKDMDARIERFQPHAAIEVALHACRTCNIESHKVGQYIRSRHGPPYLKIVTD